MQIAIPDVNKTLNTLMAVRSTFEDRTQSISDWVMEHRNEMKKNQLLLAVKSPANDIACNFKYISLQFTCKSNQGRNGSKSLRRITNDDKRQG